MKQGFGDIVEEKSIHQNALLNFLCKLLIFEEYSNVPHYEHICLKSVQSSELSEQTTKIAKLIRQLKQQERAYVELLERSLVSRPLL